VDVQGRLVRQSALVQGAAMIRLVFRVVADSIGLILFVLTALFMVATIRLAGEIITSKTTLITPPAAAVAVALPRLSEGSRDLFRSEV